MSEEQNAPKKAARKRVVKKGVRGTRAPRKKTVSKKEDSPVEAEEAAHEDFSAEENEVTYSLESNEPVEAPQAEAPQVEEPQQEIKVVEEEASKKSEDRPRKNSKSSKEKESKDKEKDAKEESKSDEDASSKSESAEKNSDESGGDDEERREGRRRNRNRRGGKDRDRDDSSQKSRKIDREEAAVKAWEIYQGELEEEGVSLVDPRRAREVARRCLELATVFCEERDRYLER